MTEEAAIAEGQTAESDVTVVAPEPAEVAVEEPAPLYTACPLNFEQYLRKANADGVNEFFVVTSLNSAGDVVFAITPHDATYARQFAVIGEIARNISKLAA